MDTEAKKFELTFYGDDLTLFFFFFWDVLFLKCTTSEATRKKGYMSCKLDK